MPDDEPTPKRTSGPSFRSRVRDAGRGELARSTGVLLASQVGQTATQAVYFLIIARALGVSSYGVFVAAAGLAAAVGPFGSFGMSTLIVRDVAREPARVRELWGSALAVVCLFGVTLALVYTAAAGLLLPTGSVALIACIGFADIFLLGVHRLTAQMFLGMGMVRRSGQVPLYLNVSRCACAALYLAFGDGSATGWAVLYLVSAVIAAVLGIVQARRVFGAPRVDRVLVRRAIRDGGTFALGDSSTSIYNDIDKPLVARWGSIDAAGAYGAGYRVVNIALAPARSLIYAAVARFYQHGVRGVEATVEYAKQLVPVATGIGVVVGIGLYVTAPLAPVLFGSEFGDASDTMRLLAPMPLLKALQSLAGDALSGAQHQSTRTTAHVVAMLVNIGLNAWLIPMYSYRGAIIATLVCDVLLVSALWGALAVYVRRARHEPVAPPP